MESSELTDETVDGQELLINRTGIMLNPEMGAELLQGAKETAPSSEGDGEEMRLERAEYLQEGTPIGSYPSLVDGDESEGTAQPVLDGNRTEVLLDKLGERLAFERQGTRLYEMLMQKVKGAPMEHDNAPATEELRHICDEELEHFEFLQQAIVNLGGDATVETPSADVAGVISHGVLQIVSDPRTSVAQSLQAVLTAELADNDGWRMLKDLSENLGYDDLAKQCAQAFDEEQEHLENVRAWLSHMILADAIGDGGSGDHEPSDEQSDKPRTRRSGTSKRKSAAKKRKK